MEGIQTFKGSWPWPWPWIRPYGIPSCITDRPLPIYQISLKSKKLFVDGRTDVRTDIFPPSNFIRSTFGSRPKKRVKDIWMKIQVSFTFYNFTSARNKRYSNKSWHLVRMSEMSWKIWLLEKYWIKKLQGNSFLSEIYQTSRMQLQQKQPMATVPPFNMTELVTWQCTASNTWLCSSHMNLLITLWRCTLSHTQT